MPMKMKKNTLLLMVFLLFSSNTYAEESVSNEPVENTASDASLEELFKDFTMVNKVYLFSEYYTRGLSQTQEMPGPILESAIVHKSGIYGGVFIARVEYFDGDQADQEWDYFIAHQKKYDNGVYHRVGLIYYTFPNAQSRLNYDFWEADLALGYDFGPLYSEVYLRTSPNHYANSGHSRYVRLAGTVPLNENKIRLKSHISHRYIEDNQTFFNIPDAFDWEIGFEYTVVENTDFIVRYVDSNLSNSDCLNSDFCSERFVVGRKLYLLGVT